MMKYVNFEDQSEDGNEIFDIVENGTQIELSVFLKSDECNINAQDKHGLTALHLATQLKKIHIVKELIEHGANLSIEDDVSDLATHKAAFVGSLEALAMLIDNDKDLLDQPGNASWTALHYAVQRNHTQIVKFLILRGANINARSSFNETPLIRAVANESLEAAEELLVAKKIDIYVKDSQGNNALFYLERTAKSPKHKYGNSKVFQLIKVIKNRIQKDKIEQNLVQDKE